MKKKIFFTMAFIAMGFSGHIYAQQASQGAVKSKNNNQNNRSCAGSITSTENGITISFYEVKAPRDLATGQASGKRQHKPFNFVVSSADNTVTETKGKVVTGAATSSDKVSYSDMTVNITKDGSSVNLPVGGGEFTIPADLADGSYEMVLSWSWGVSNSRMKNGTVKFFVEMKNGSCFGINEQGVK